MYFSHLINSPSQKKVTFSPRTRIRRIEKTEQSSGSNTWYQRRDYKAFEVDCEKTAEIARDLERSRNSTYARTYISTRGLEVYIDEKRAELRRERILASWDIVLDEQTYQYESGYDQPQHIAEAYQEVSVRCQKEAHVKALQYLQESEAEHQRESRLLCEAPKSGDLCNTNLRAKLTRRPGKKNLFLSTAA
jgi:hypothetical protein